jgi:oligopeptide/dipeptide ABC transporter ATP-binding protein
LPAQAQLEAESIRLRGRELTTLTEPEYRGLRGKDVAMIFQEPMTALNPVFTVGEQVAEGIRLHEQLGWRAAWDRAIQGLHEVGIPDPRRRARSYPHQLSGGMRQRVLLAIALACRPALLLADEPTTALDMTTQAQIVDLLLRLRAEHRFALLLITHDLGLVAEMAHDVAVMYAGQIVEQTDVKTLFARPLHPYTRGLLASVPRLDPLPPASGALPRFAVLEGTVPDLAQAPIGCRFAPRCPHALAACRQPQGWRLLGTDHGVRCIRAEDLQP